MPSDALNLDFTKVDGKRQNFYQSAAEREAYISHVSDIPEVTIAWFTGWLCADGSIMRYGGGLPRVRFAITDSDPLEKMAGIFGGNVSDPKEPSKHGFGVKKVYSWTISGEKAYHILRRCRPWMSERYAAKADAIFDSWTPRTDRGQKITAHDVANIKRAIADGQTGRSQAQFYGVSDGQISSIKLGRSWRDVAAAEES